MNPESSRDTIAGAMHREEINSLKIEKLGNRITIISILLPCFIGIILFFAYMDIQARVAIVNNTGKSEVKTVSDNLQTKINSMIVDLAKINHLLDIKFPKLEKTSNSLEAQLVRLTAAKADKKKVQTAMDLLKKKVTNNKNQYKKALDIIDKTKTKIFSAINDSNAGLKKIQLSLNGRITKLKTSLKKDLAEFELINKEVSIIKKNIKLDREHNKALLEQKIGKKELSARLKALKKDVDAKINMLLDKQRQKTIKKPLPGLKPKSISLHKGQGHVLKQVKASSESPMKKTPGKINPDKIIEKDLSN